VEVLCQNEVTLLALFPNSMGTTPVHFQHAAIQTIVSSNLLSPGHFNKC